MTLEEFIASNPDARELKRALAVKMRLEGMKHKQIQPVLGVVSSFISHWEKRYQEAWFKTGVFWVTLSRQNKPSINDDYISSSYFG